MAANRTDSFAGAMRRIWGRGGIFGCEIPEDSAANRFAVANGL